MRYISHIRDYTFFTVQCHASPLLYIFLVAIRPGNLRTNDRPPVAAGRYMGGKHGSQN
jgi:hypothetical protein